METTRIELPVLALASPTAFAFATRADGATLVWSAPGPQTEIHELRLSRGGNPLGGSALVVRADSAGGVATDLAAVRVGEGLAVAWVERLDREARVQAAWNDGRHAASVFDLGNAWHTRKSVRGNLALAADGDRALVFARGQSEACVSPDERQCFGFAMHRIGNEASQPRGLPLNVPVPCERNSTHLEVSGGGWYYGVCTTLDGKRVTTLFDIQFNPEYARAERLLPGCQPLGIVKRTGAPWLVGACGEQRLAVKLGETGAKPVDLGKPELVCRGRRLELQLRGASEPLGDSRTDLAPLLPKDLTEGLAQTVHTGGSLLIARGEGNELSIVRHACVPRDSSHSG